MFIANKLMMIEGKSLNTISEAQSLNTFLNIRVDINKLTYSMYIAELVNVFCSKNYNQDENYEEIYNLLYKTYDIIANSKTKNEVLICTIKFLIQFLTILGWGLDFKYCSTCQKEITSATDTSCIFSYELGGFLCNTCAKNHPFNTIKIHNKIKIFLHELQKTNIENKTKYDDLVNDIVLEKCFSFIKKYIENLTNKRTKVFEVLESISV
jgi:DNA repair protein RecO (recombination protein O)